MDEEDTDSADTGLPSSSRDFRELFLSTVTQGEQFANNCVRRAIPRLMGDIGKRTHPYHERLLSVLRDSGADERVSEFDSKHTPAPGRRSSAALLRILRRAADPRGSDLCDRMIESVFDPERGISLNARFPLPGEEDHQAPQVFPWAGNKTGDTRTHQILLCRLRDALAQGARQPVLQLASELNEIVFEVVEENITTAIDRLDEMSNHAAFLACLTNENANVEERRGWKASAILLPSAIGA
jgi:hypothetical protein